MTSDAASQFVPGVMYCAKCSFVLHRMNLHALSGNVSAGDNKTEPCPNGCGPLWPMTWRKQAEELQERLEEQLAHIATLQRSADEMREALSLLAREARAARDMNCGPGIGYIEHAEAVLKALPPQETK